MKNKIAILLVLPILVLGGYMLYLNAMTEFNRVEVVVQGYDPKDFLSGYYFTGDFPCITRKRCLYVLYAKKAHKIISQ